MLLGVCFLHSITTADSGLHGDRPVQAASPGWGRDGELGQTLHSQLSIRPLGAPVLRGALARPVFTST